MYNMKNKKRQPINLIFKDLSAKSIPYIITLYGWEIRNWHWIYVVPTIDRNDTVCTNSFHSPNYVSSQIISFPLRPI
jgi:hypothetical protein